MKHVRRLTLILLVCVLVSTGAFALGLLGVGNPNAGTVTVTEEEYALLQKYKRLQEIMDVVDQVYLWEYDEEAMMEGAAQGMLRALGDDYTFYYTPEQMEEENEMITGEYGGLGIEVFMNLSDDTITIRRVFHGGPAQQAGIRPFDKIIGVNGEEMRAADINDAVKVMRGEPGGEVTLVLLREDEIFEVTLERAIVQTEIIQYEMLEDNIGYIRIFYFEGSLMSQFEEAKQALMAQGIEGLVIDLRENPGGLVNLAIDLVDVFVDEDAVVMQNQDKYGRKLSYYAKKGAWDIPLAVLQDGSSASASEIVAIALQENLGATVVGVQSYGKGIMQAVYPFTSDGAGMQLTSDYWLSPEGNNLHEIGVTPDIEVELAEDAKDENYNFILEKDNQLQAAMEALREQIAAAGTGD